MNIIKFLQNMPAGQSIKDITENTANMDYIDDTQLSYSLISHFVISNSSMHIKIDANKQIAYKVSGKPHIANEYRAISIFKKKSMLLGSLNFLKTDALISYLDADNIIYTLADADIEIPSYQFSARSATVDKSQLSNYYMEFTKRTCEIKVLDYYINIKNQKPASIIESYTAAGLTKLGNYKKPASSYTVSKSSKFSVKSTLQATVPSVKSVESNPKQATGFWAKELEKHINIYKKMNLKQLVDRRELASIKHKSSQYKYHECFYEFVLYTPRKGKGKIELENNTNFIYDVIE